MGFRINNSEDYEHIDVRLINFPIAFKAKCEEYIAEGNASNMEEAKKLLADCVIELELIYDKGNGLFAVESEAMDSASDEIVSPYTGETAENADDEEEPYLTCPECGSHNVRYFFDADVDDMHCDEEGYQCEDCHYQGDKSDFEE